MKIKSDDPINGPVNLTDRQELILQMFAEDKCLSIGRLCEKTGLLGMTAKRESAFLKSRMCVAMLRGVAGRGHALFLKALIVNEL